MSEPYREGGASRVTLIYDTGERDDDALKRYRWVIPLSFLGATVVLFLAIMEWMRPYAPMLLFAATVVLPVALYLLWSLGVRRWRSAAVVTGVVALFGLPLVAWNLGVYRAMVYVSAGEMTPVDLSMDASDDRSDRVAALACEDLLSSGELARLQRAQGILETRPDMASRCLEGLDDGGRGAVVRMARHLHGHWYDEWMEPQGGLETSMACEAAQHFEKIGDLYDADPTPRLLSCALGAADEEVSRCCAQALGEFDRRSRAVHPERWPGDIEESLFERLLEATDLGADELLSSDPVDSSMEWTAGELFHWKVHIGCQLIKRDIHTEGMARQLWQPMEAQCGLAVDDPLYSFAGVTFVERTCEGAMETSKEAESTVDVVQWCDAARTASRQTAVDTAKFAVHRAARAHEVDVLEQWMVRGSEWLEIAESEESRFAVDEHGRSYNADAVGIRLRRPEWTDHTPDAQRRREAMEDDYQQRRTRARRQIADDDSEATDEQLDRAAKGQAGRQIRDEIQKLRDGADN